MGNNGSYTSKANIPPALFLTTKWNKSNMRDFLHRGMIDLGDTFGLRKFEFEFLIGKELIDYTTSKLLFEGLFDTDKNGIVDKFEVMAVACLASKLSNHEKIHFIFDLFNFNNKGFLLESEINIMFQSVTRGVFKADSKYIPPPRAQLQSLVKDLLSYAKVDAKAVRRPELIHFATTNKEILAFFESWRGHASQVLLGSNEKWRDLSFPASDSSITPTRDWITLGLPPPDRFVKWRRRDKVGNDVGCIYLFTHEVSFLKTFDRRNVYKENGVIGAGHLKQGMLADRWVLNALAAMICRPDTITNCFAETGQEDVGRFCVRMYEGGSWHSVYVDDRIPCGPDALPLFSTSSNTLEAWPILLEKGMAKYFGSYGHLAMCSVRSDAPLTALRMLTGAHILKYSTKDYEWRSVEDDVIGENGYLLVKNMHLEGSLVSFCRSESMTVVDNDKKVIKTTKKITSLDQNPSRGGTPTGTPTHKKRVDVADTTDKSKKGEEDDDEDDNPVVRYPPYGRFFPYLGMTMINGYRHLILRDAWDLMEDRNCDVDVETGHCNTFLVKIEDIPDQYDTLIIARFPDSLRSKAAAIRLRPWNTIVVDSHTHGSHHPAKFQLTVHPGNAALQASQAADAERTAKSRKTPSQVDVNEILKSSDELNDPDPMPVIRLKEKLDFTHQKARDRQSIRSELSSKRRSKLEQKETFYGDITFTISSSCKWIVGGANASGAKLRVRVVPSPKTLVSLIQNAKELAKERRRKHLQMAAKKAAEARLLEELKAADSAESKTALDLSNHDTISNPPSAGASPSATPIASRRKVSYHADLITTVSGTNNSSPESSRNHSFTAPLVSALSASKTASAEIGGEDSNPVSNQNYYNIRKISALSFNEKDFSSNRNSKIDEPEATEDTSSNPSSYEKKFDIILTGERTWSSHTVKMLSGDYYFLADVSYDIDLEKAHELSQPLDSGEPIWLQHSKAATNTLTKLMPKGLRKQALERRKTIASMSTHGNTNFSAAASNHEDSVMSMDSVHHRIWLQVSSHDRFNVAAVNDVGHIETTLQHLEVFPERWPLVGETQADVSSRELVITLGRLRKEAQLVSVELATLTNRLKTELKQRRIPFPSTS